MALASVGDTTIAREPADILAAVRRVGPVIDAAAEAADRERRLPPELLDALHEAALFRLLLPRQFGGAEVGPPTFFEAIEAVARHDASTAWCLCQANGCAMTAAYLEPEVADKIWGRDPRAVLAWGPGKGEAVVDGDGYRLSGNWSFASGGRHATWLGAQSTVVEADGKPRRLADGTVAVRTLLFPANRTEFTDIWDVIGLRGTGSDAYAVTDLAVAHDHSVARDDPGERRCDTPLYQFPAMSLYATGFSATALGIAQTMLAAFIELAAGKTPRLAHERLKDNAVIQSETAQAQARLGSARAFLLSELSEIWDDVSATNRLTAAQRMRIRLAATHGIHEAKSAANMIYELAGASAIFASGAYERRFRDIHTVAQQLQGRRSHFQTVGAYLLGHPPDMSVI